MSKGGREEEGKKGRGERGRGGEGEMGRGGGVRERARASEWGHNTFLRAYFTNKRSCATSPKMDTVFTSLTLGVTVRMKH